MRHIDPRQGIVCVEPNQRPRRRVLKGAPGYAFPPNVDPESINASFKDGVLEITTPIPKQEPRGRKIDIHST